MIALSIGLAGLLALMLLGVPIGFAMGLVGFVGFGALIGWAPAGAMLGQVAFDNTVTYTMSVLPLFILMGNFVTFARLSEELYAASNAFLGHLPGGLSMATIVACGAFSAISGSSLATAATMSKVAIPSMSKYGYAPGFAAGSVAAGGTLGILIPPSVILVIYGIMTTTDIGKLLIAGIVPGLLGILLYTAAVATVVRVWPHLAPPGDRTPWPMRLRSLARVWGVVVLFILIMGGIYLGVFTPTEAAGVGAAGSFLFALSRRSLNWERFFKALASTCRTTAALFILLIGALTFSNFIEVAGLPAMLASFVGGLELSPITLLLVVLAIYVALGCFFDTISMLFLTLPLFFPIIAASGIDPIWFGILLVVAMEVGLITPPVGMNVFVMRATTPDLPTSRIFLGVTPFVIADVGRLGLLIAVPGLALWLPSLM